MANHISHASLPYPVKNARYTIPVPYLDADGDPTDPTTPDTEISIDAAAFADCAEEVTTITGSNGAGYLTLSGAEMNCSLAVIAAKVASGPKATLMTLSPRVLPILESGTAQAGAAGTITLASGAANYPLVGAIVRTTGGTGGGGTGGANNQARVITAYNSSTKVATISPNWETTPDSSTTYDILLTEMAGNALNLYLTLDSVYTSLLADTNDIQSRLPAALVSGRMDASVGAMASGVLTATAIAADAITDAKVASDVTIASVTGSVGSVTGAVGSVTGNVGGNVTGSVGSLAAQAQTDIITALQTSGLITNRTTIATLTNQTSFTLTAGSADDDAYNGAPVVFIDASTAAQRAYAIISDYTGATKTVTLKAAPAFTIATTDIICILSPSSMQGTKNILTDLQDLSQANVRSAVGLASANLDTQLTAIDDYLDTEIAAILAAVDTEVAAIKAVTDLLPDAGALTSLATAAALDTVDNFLDTEIAAIKAKTDNLPTDPADESSIQAAIAALDTKIDTIDNFIDTEIADIQARLPAALVGGRIDANVGAISSDSTAADNLEAEYDGTGYKSYIRRATAQAGAASTITLDASANASDDYYNNQVLGIISGTGAGQGRIISDYVGATKVATVNGNWVTNPSSDSVFIILPLGAIPGATAPTAAEIADAVWDEATAGHSTAGTTGKALTDAGSAGDPWSTALPGAYGAGTAGKIVGDNLNATVSSRASQSTLDTLDDYVDTEVAAIKAVTDLLPDAGALTSLATQASVNTIDDFLDTEVAAIKAKTDNLPTDPADQSAVEAAITTSQSAILSKLLKYVQLMVRKDAAIGTDNATEKTAINADGGSGAGAFNQTTDALEAAADRMALDSTVAKDATVAKEATLGTPAGASVSADIAAVKAQTAAIETDTQDIQSRLPAALVSGRMDASVGAMAANVMTAAASAADLITEIQSGLATAAALDIVDNFLDTEIATILAAVDTEIAAIKAVTDALPNGGALTDIKADTAAILDDTGTSGVVIAAASKTGMRLSSQGVLDFFEKTLSELAAVPSATPQVQELLMLLYMALRNKVTQTATEQKIHNSAGSQIGVATCSDDGTTAQKGKYS